MCSFNKGVLELTRVDSRACASRSHLTLSWSLARSIVFGSSQLEDRVDFGGEGKRESDEDDDYGDTVLAQRPITLILMMINSCSYGTNALIFIKILVGV